MHESCTPLNVAQTVICWRSCFDSDYISVKSGATSKTLIWPQSWINYYIWPQSWINYYIWPQSWIEFNWHTMNCARCTTDLNSDAREWLQSFSSEITSNWSSINKIRIIQIFNEHIITINSIFMYTRCIFIKKFNIVYKATVIRRSYEIEVHSASVRSS